MMTVEMRQLSVTEREVAEALGLSVATLRAWRLQGRGPRFLKFGRAVRYRWEEIERFMALSTVETIVGGGSA